MEDTRLKELYKAQFDCYDNDEEKHEDLCEDGCHEPHERLYLNSTEIPDLTDVTGGVCSCSDEPEKKTEPAKSKPPCPGPVAPCPKPKPACPKASSPEKPSTQPPPASSKPPPEACKKPERPCLRRQRRSRRCRKNLSCKCKARGKGKYQSRPRTKNAFIVFFLTMYYKCPNRNVTEVAREAGKIWRCMDPLEKEIYVSKAQAIKRRLMRKGRNNYKAKVYENGCICSCDQRVHRKNKRRCS